MVGKFFKKLSSKEDWALVFTKGMVSKVVLQRGGLWSGWSLVITGLYLYNDCIRVLMTDGDPMDDCRVNAKVWTSTTLLTLTRPKAPSTHGWDHTHCGTGPASFTRAFWWSGEHAIIYSVDQIPCPSLSGQHPHSKPSLCHNWVYWLVFKRQ